MLLPLIILLNVADQQNSLQFQFTLSMSLFMSFTFSILEIICDEDPSKLQDATLKTIFGLI
jgi:hypothetical protein